MRHLRVIAQRPRPIGSDEHASVRNYLFNELSALGLNPQVQTATAVNEAGGPPYRVGTARNVIGRLAGTDGGRAVLLVAHYDSVATGPGASDDGAGVAALLETGRALNALPTRRNDVIFLFTDGEETGLLGARAFAAEHPWAKNVGVVLNFEARGSDGPVIMFETSPDNGWLVQQLAAAAPHPLANSLSYEIYRRLPNDTDFTSFKKVGLPGMNFAYINGIQRYHAATDDLNHISERSLQHHGTYAVSLAQRLGNLNFSEVRRGSAIYFNPIGFTFVHYPSGLVLPLAVLAALLFVGVTVVGFKRGLLTYKGLAFGFLTPLLCVIAAAVTVTVAWLLVRALHPGYESVPWGEPYNRVLYLFALVLLTMVVVLALHNWFRRKTNLQNLVVGGLFWWTLATIVVSLLVPGGSYLLTWPLLFALVATIILFLWRGGEPAKRFFVLALYAVPAIALFSPLLNQIMHALTLNAAGVLAVMLVFLTLLLIPQLDLLLGPKPWAVPGLAGVLGLLLIVAGLATASPDAKHPKANNIFYSLNADNGRALWVSSDRQPDEWTKQFFGAGVEQGALTDFYPLRNRTFLQSQAPVVTLPAPQVTLLRDSRTEKLRTLHLRITSPRGASVLSVYASPHSELVSASVGGLVVATKSDDQNQWGVNYYGLPADGVEVSLSFRPSQPIELRVIDRTYSLPEGLAVTRRPDHTMPLPAPYSDATVISKSYRF